MSRAVFCRARRAKYKGRARATNNFEQQVIKSTHARLVSPVFLSSPETNVLAGLHVLYVHPRPNNNCCFLFGSFKFKTKT